MLIDWWYNIVDQSSWTWRLSCRLGPCTVYFQYIALVFISGGWKWDFCQKILAHLKIQFFSQKTHRMSVYVVLMDFGDEPSTQHLKLHMESVATGFLFVGLLRRSVFLGIYGWNFGFENANFVKFWNLCVWSNCDIQSVFTACQQVQRAFFQLQIVI